MAPPFGSYQNMLALKKVVGWHFIHDTSDCTKEVGLVLWLYPRRIVEYSYACIVKLSFFMCCRAYKTYECEYDKKWKSIDINILYIDYCGASIDKVFISATVRVKSKPI